MPPTSIELLVAFTLTQIHGQMIYLCNHIHRPQHFNILPLCPSSISSSRLLSPPLSPLFIHSHSFAPASCSHIHRISSHSQCILSEWSEKSCDSRNCWQQSSHMIVIIHSASLSAIRMTHSSLISQIAPANQQKREKINESKKEEEREGDGSSWFREIIILGREKDAPRTGIYLLGRKVSLTETCLPFLITQQYGILFTQVSFEEQE